MPYTLEKLGNIPAMGSSVPDLKHVEKANALGTSTLWYCHELCSAKHLLEIMHKLSKIILIIPAL